MKLVERRGDKSEGKKQDKEWIIQEVERENGKGNKRSNWKRTEEWREGREE